MTSLTSHIMYKVKYFACVSMSVLDSNLFGILSVLVTLLSSGLPSKSVASPSPVWDRVLKANLISF